MPFQLFDSFTGIQLAESILTGLLASVHGYLGILGKPNMLISDSISCLLSAMSSTTYTSTLWQAIRVLNCQHLKCSKVAETRHLQALPPGLPFISQMPFPSSRGQRTRTPSFYMTDMEASLGYYPTHYRIILPRHGKVVQFPGQSKLWSDGRTLQISMV